MFAPSGIRVSEPDKVGQAARMALEKGVKESHFERVGPNTATAANPIPKASVFPKSACAGVPAIRSTYLR